MNHSGFQVDVRPVERLQLAATKPRIQGSRPYRPITKRDGRDQRRRLRRPRHPLPSQTTAGSDSFNVGFRSTSPRSNARR